MRAVTVTLVLLATLVPLAPSASAATFTVSASNFQWSPSPLTIAPGDSVTFTNEQGTHNWVRDDAEDSCSLPCTRTFPEAALVEYHCGFHPSMTGSIVVSLPVSVTILSPSAGASVSGSVLVTGTASHPDAAIDQVLVRIGTTDVLAELDGAGTSVSWSALVQSTSVANGPATIQARASAGAASGSASVAVVVANPERIDLRVTSAAAQSNAVRANIVSFTIVNDGNVGAPASVARGEYFYEGAWHAFGDVQVPALASHATFSSTVVWSPTLAVGAFDIRVVADPDGLVDDADRSNNARATRGAFVTLLVPGVVVA